MGRWLSPDPLFGKLIAPQTLNRYTYVLNNPLRYIDPLGLLHCKVTKGKDGKEQTSDCVSDDDYNKNKDKYPDHKKVTRQEEVTVTADGTSTQAKPWHSYTVWIAGVPRRLKQTKYLDLDTKIKIIADAMPTICNGGGFGYLGAEASGPVHAFGGGIVEFDTKDGFGGGSLTEVGAGEGVFIGGSRIDGPGGQQDLAYGGAGIKTPLVSGAAGVVGFTSGAGVFGEAGAFGIKGGLGAYLNVTTNAGCRE